MSYAEKAAKHINELEARIAELEAENERLERLLASRDKRIQQLLRWRREHEQSSG